MMRHPHRDLDSGPEAAAVPTPRVSLSHPTARDGGRDGVRQVRACAFEHKNATAAPMKFPGRAIPPAALSDLVLSDRLIARLHASDL